MKETHQSLSTGEAFAQFAESQGVDLTSKKATPPKSQKKSPRREEEAPLTRREKRRQRRHNYPMIAATTAMWGPAGGLGYSLGHAFFRTLRRIHDAK
jgi:hypothetical protein